MISLLNQLVDSLCLRLFSASSPSEYLKSNLSAMRDFKKNFDYSNPEPVYLDLPNLGKFRLLHVGHAPYEFVLDNPEIAQIYLCNPDKFLSKFAINTGQLYIDFSSKYLQCQGDDLGLIDLFLESCFELFYEKKQATFVRTSRGDLAADISGYDFSWDDTQKLSTRARKLQPFIEDDVQASELSDLLDILEPQIDDKGVANDTSPKLRPEGETPKFSVQLTARQISLLSQLVRSDLDNPCVFKAILAKSLQTLYIGRFGSKLYARIYCKTNEIKISGKEFLEIYWKEKGWDGEAPVWRVEFSMSGDFLKEFWTDGENSLDYYEFKKNIKKIWTYLTESWCRHTDAECSTNARSQNSEFWNCVSSAFDYDNTFVRIPLPAPPSESKAAQLLAQAKGCLKTYSALIIGGFHKAFGFEEEEQIEYLPHLLDAVSKEFVKDCSYQEITERREKLGCDEFSDTQFSAALRANRIKLGRGS